MEIFTSTETIVARKMYIKRKTSEVNLIFFCKNLEYKRHPFFEKLFRFTVNSKKDNIEFKNLFEFK